MSLKKNVRVFVVEKFKKCRLACSQLTNKQLCLIVVLSVAFLALFVFLIFFLIIIPIRIRESYRTETKFQNIRFSRLHLFPDNDTYVTLTVEGELFHPSDMLTYERTFHTWRFKTGHGEPIFEDQPFTELERTVNKNKSKFISNMSIRRKGFIFNPDLFTAKVQDKSKASAFSSSSSKHELDQIELIGNIGWYSDISIEIPASEFKTAVREAAASAHFLDKESGLKGLKFSEIMISLTEKGIQFKSQYSTDVHTTEFKLSKGTYPIFYYNLPVLVLIANEDMDIRRNINDDSLKFDMNFVKKYEETGKDLLLELSLSMLTGETRLSLGKQGLGSQQEWTSSMLKDTTAKLVNFPNFQHHLDEFNRFLSQGKPQLHSLKVVENRIELALQLQLPQILKLNSLSINFGAKFKLHSGAHCIAELELSNLSIRTKNEHSFIQMNVVLIFPQSDTEIKALEKLYQDILTPQSSLSISIRKFIFFPTPTLPNAFSSAAPSFVKCAWCDVLFSKQNNTLPLISDDFKFDTTDSSFISALNLKDHFKTNYAKVSQLFISRKRGSNTFHLNTLLDTTLLNIEMLNLPFMSGNLMYHTHVLGKFSLPKGLHSQTSISGKHELQVESEFEISRMQSVQPLFKELIESMLHSKFTVQQKLGFSKFKVGEENAGLNTFESFTFGIHLNEIRELSQILVQFDPLDGMNSMSISLLNFQLKVVNPFVYVLNLSVKVNQGLPIFFDLENLGFVLHASKFENLHVLISKLKTERDTTLIQINEMIITCPTKDSSISNTVSRILIAMFKRDKDLPTQLSLKKITFDESPTINLSPERLNFPVFESLSSLEYTFDLPQLKPASQSFHLFDFKIFFNAFALNSLNIVKLYQATNVVTLELALDLKVNTTFAFSAKFISFDIMILGKKLGHMKIIGLEIQQKIQQVALFQVSFETNPNFLTSQRQATYCSSEPNALILGCISNLFIGGDAKDLKKDASLPLPIPLTGSTVIQILDFLIKMNPHFEIAKLQGFEKLKPVFDQVVVYFTQNAVAAQSLLNKEVLDFLCSLIFKNPTSKTRLEVKKIQTRVMDTKLILNVGFKLPPIEFDLNDLLMQFSIFNDAIELAQVKLEVVSLVNADNFSSTGTIQVEIELQSIDLQRNNVNPDILKAAIDNRENKNDSNENDLEFEKLVKLVFSSPIQIKLIQGNGKGISKRLLQWIVSLKQGLELPLPWKDSKDISFEKIYNFKSSFSQTDSNSLNFLQYIPTSSVHISFEPKIQKEGKNVFQTFFEIQLNPIPKKDIQIDFQMPSLYLSVFLKTTQVGIVSLNTIHCESCLAQPLKLKLTLDTLETALSQDVMKEYVHSIFNQDAAPLKLNFGQLRFHPSLSKKTLLNILFPPISSKVFRQWINPAPPASNRLKRSPSSLNQNLSPSSFNPAPVNEGTSVPVTPKVTIHSLSFFLDLSLDLKVGMAFDSFEWNQGKSEIHGFKVLGLHTGTKVSIFEKIKQLKDLQLTNFKFGPSSSFFESKSQGFLNLFSKIQLDAKKLLLLIEKSLLTSIQKIQLSKLAILPDASNTNFKFQVDLTYPKSLEKYMPQVELSFSISEGETLTFVSTKKESQSADFSSREINGFFVKNIKAYHESKSNIYNQVHLNSIYLDSFVIHDPDTTRRNKIEFKPSIFMIDPKLIHYFQHQIINPLIQHSVSFPRQCPSNDQSNIHPEKFQFSQVFNPQMNARAVVKFPCPSKLQLHVNHFQFDLIQLVKKDTKVGTALTIEMSDLLLQSSQPKLLWFQVKVLNRNEKVILDPSEKEALSQAENQLWILRDLKIGTSKATSRPIQNLKLFLDTNAVDLFTQNHLVSTLTAWLKVATKNYTVSPFQIDKLHIKAMNWHPSFDIDLQLAPPKPSKEMLAIPNLAFHFEFQNIELTINKTRMKPRRLYYDTHNHLQMQTFLDFPHSDVFRELSSLIAAQNFNGKKQTQLPNVYLKFDDLRFYEKMVVPIQQIVSVSMTPDAMKWVDTTNIRSAFTQVKTQTLDVTMPERAFVIRFGFQFPKPSVLQLDLSKYSVSTLVSVQPEELGLIELRSMLLTSTFLQGVIHFTPKQHANWKSLSMHLTDENAKNLAPLLPKFDFSKLEFHSLDTSVLREHASISILDTTYYQLNLNLLGPILGPKWEVFRTNTIAVEKPVPISVDIKRVRFKLQVVKSFFFGEVYSQCEIQDLQLVPNQTQLCINGNLGELALGFNLWRPKSSTIYDLCLSNHNNEEICFKGLEVNLNDDLLYDGVHLTSEGPLVQECDKKNEAKTGKELHLIIKNLED